MSGDNVYAEFPNRAEIAKRLAEVEPKIANKIVRDGVRQAAQLMAEAIKAKISAIGAVDSGTLLSSVRVKNFSRAGEIGAKAGPTDRAYYAHMIEHGYGHPSNPSIRVPARPFITPAWVENKERIHEVVTASIKTALDEALKK
jgi:HK97 gp10 family phage protein